MRYGLPATLFREDARFEEQQRPRSENPDLGHPLVRSGKATAGQLLRRAVIGSIREARRAGRKPEMRATARIAATIHA